VRSAARTAWHHRPQEPRSLNPSERKTQVSVFSKEPNVMGASRETLGLLVAQIRRHLVLFIMHNRKALMGSRSSAH
jgi:hypothetical protein